jgi:hypothetical protein
MSMTRRSFLGRSIATGAVMDLPFLGRARPASAAPLYNVIFVFVPDGIVPSLWHAKGTETDFTLPAMSEPLNAIRNDSVFLEGITMYAGEPTHPGGTKKVITATGPQSLDVFLGGKLKGSAPFDSLQLGVQSNFENGSGSISYVGLGQELKPDDNPLNVFDRVFAGAKPGTGGGAPGGIDLVARQRKSILDAIRGDLTSLQAKLGAAEKSRLDIHLQSLRDVEQRATTMMITPTGPACDVASFNKGGFVVPANDYNYPKVYDKPENFAIVGQLQMDLTVLALSCNMTRVVTLMWSHAVSPTKIPGWGRRSATTTPPTTASTPRGRTPASSPSTAAGSWTGWCRWCRPSRRPPSPRGASSTAPSSSSARTSTTATCTTTAACRSWSSAGPRRGCAATATSTSPARGWAGRTRATPRSWSPSPARSGSPSTALATPAWGLALCRGCLPEPAVETPVVRSPT